VSEFTYDWLELREPADSAARSTAATQNVLAALPPGRPARVLDLAAGTGANFRYLSSYLPAGQQWLLVDRDESLLARAPENASVTRLRADLRVLQPGLFDDRNLVTASALLDLVSSDWLTVLVDRCRDADAQVLFALTYDGRWRCWPADPLDDVVRALVNDHQTTDKGFGPALGPAASGTADRVLSSAGYTVLRAASDWMLAPDHDQLQRSLIAGWAEAASVIAPGQRDTIAAWRASRLAHVEAGDSRVLVGHQDLAGVIRTRR
jgi:hypothetical protein